MPLYDYKCAKCQETTEVRHGFKETYWEPCPKCGGKLNRVFNPAGIVFKGSGFYINDSRPAPASESKSEPKTEPKSEPKTETKSKSDTAA